ncbi:hypothetical protein QE400_003432 [Xanthomonas sacchari]|nr:hypothetical protein [Xanthomonas sacchari]
MQFLADRRIGQLVVGGAADDLDLQPRQLGLVERAFQGARRQHVGGDVVDLVRGHRFGTVFGHRARDQRRVQVGHVQLGAAFLEQLHQLHADVAQALHGDAGLADLLMAELALQRGHQRLQRAVGGERGRIAGAAMHLVHAGDVLGLQVDLLHVVDVGADVLGGDVAAAQRIDVAAEGAEQRFGLVALRVADDHRLAAADVEPGQRVLVGHGAAEPQRVLQRRFGVGVGAHAHAAQRRAEYGVVDGDDRLQSHVAVVAEDDLFVAGVG